MPVRGRACVGQAPPRIRRFTSCSGSGRICRRSHRLEQTPGGCRCNPGSHREHHPGSAESPRTSTCRPAPSSPAAVCVVTRFCQTDPETADHDNPAVCNACPPDVSKPRFQDRRQCTKAHQNAPKRTKRTSSGAAGSGKRSTAVGHEPRQPTASGLPLMEMLMINMFACSGALHPDGWVLGPEGGCTPRPYGARP